MKDARKPRPRRRLAIVTLTLAILTVSYAALHARELRCCLVAYSDLKRIGPTFYADPAMAPRMVDSVRRMMADASVRDAGLFGGALRSSPVVIAGEDARVIEGYGQSGNTTAATHSFLGSTYIVLGPDGLDRDVIAHEMMHAELSERVGWLRKEMAIPAWFDEGLAMQADQRAAFSEDAWRRMTDAGAHAPALSEMTGQSGFATDDAALRFATARHEVARWLAVVGRPGLARLLERVADGESFGEAYGDIESRR